MCPLLPPLKLDKVGDYSDDIKKNTFNNGGNNAHGLKKR